VFGTRRVLKDISDRLAGVGDTLADMGDTLAGMDERLAEMTEELRSQREDNRRDHELTRAAINNIQQVNREILLELRDHRPILERIDHGVHANTAGLMHVLDELRNGRGGPGTAPAT
jgi:hypothetical protein